MLTASNSNTTPLSSLHSGEEATTVESRKRLRRVTFHTDEMVVKETQIDDDHDDDHGPPAALSRSDGKQVQYKGESKNDSPNEAKREEDFVADSNNLITRSQVWNELIRHALDLATHLLALLVNVVIPAVAHALVACISAILRNKDKDNEKMINLMALLGVWNLTIIILARYTDFCGRPRNGGAVFCSEYFIFQYRNEDDNVMLRLLLLNPMAMGWILYLQLTVYRLYRAWNRHATSRREFAAFASQCLYWTQCVCASIRCTAAATSTSMALDRHDRRRAVAYASIMTKLLKLHLCQQQLTHLTDMMTTTTSTTKTRKQDSSMLFVRTLRVQEVANLQRVDNKPLYCQTIMMHYISKQVRTKKLSAHQQSTMNMSMMELVKCISSCEQFLLQRTAAEVTRTAAIRARVWGFVVFLWLLLLPLQMAALYGWWSCLSIVVTFSLLEIERMIAELENPFDPNKGNHSDLEDICQRTMDSAETILRLTEGAEKVDNNDDSSSLFDAITRCPIGPPSTHSKATTSRRSSQNRSLGDDKTDSQGEPEGRTSTQSSASPRQQKLYSKLKEVVATAAATAAKYRDMPMMAAANDSSVPESVASSQTPTSPLSSASRECTALELDDDNDSFRSKGGGEWGENIVTRYQGAPLGWLQQYHVGKRGSIASLGSASTDYTFDETDKDSFSSSAGEHPRGDDFNKAAAAAIQSKQAHLEQGEQKYQKSLQIALTRRLNADSTLRATVMRGLARENKERKASMNETVLKKKAPFTNGGSGGGGGDVSEGNDEGRAHSRKLNRKSVYRNRIMKQFKQRSTRDSIKEWKDPDSNSAGDGIVMGEPLPLLEL